MGIIRDKSKVKLRHHGYNWSALVDGVHEKYMSGARVRFYVCNEALNKTDEEMFEIFFDRLSKGEYASQTRDGYKKLIQDENGNYKMVPVEGEEAGTLTVQNASGGRKAVHIRRLKERYPGGSDISFKVCLASEVNSDDEVVAIFHDRVVRGEVIARIKGGYGQVVIDKNGRYKMVHISKTKFQEIRKRVRRRSVVQLQFQTNDPEQKELFENNKEDQDDHGAKESSSAEEAKFKSTPEEWYIQGYDDGYNKGVATIANPLKEEIHEIQAQLRHDHLREYHAVQLDEIIYLLCHELQRAKDLKKSDSDKPRIYAMSGMCDGYNDGVIVTINLVVDKIHEIKCNLKKWDMCDYDANRLYHEVYSPLHRAWQRALELQRMSKNQESLQEDDGEIMTVDEIAKFLKEHDVEFENYGKWFYINHYFGRKYNADELARLIKEHELNAERKGESV